MPISNANGTPVYYEVHGDGFPVLLVTGMANVLDWFHFTIPVLAEEFKVVAQDLRGSNREGVGPAPGPYTTAEMALDSIGILDGLGIEKAHVVGLSMGGMIAQHLAISHQDRVAKVAIVGNGLARTPREIADAALAQDQGSDVARLHTHDLTEDQKLQMALQLIFTPGFAEAKPDRYSFFLDLHNNHGPHPETHQAQVMAAIKHDTLDDLHKITAPVQLLVGELDHINGGLAHEMAERIPNCDFRVLPGMAHGLTIEHAEEFNQLLLDFLR